MSTPLIYPRDAFAQVDAIRDAPAAERAAYLEIFDVVFFASMMLEEGETIPIGVVFDDDGRLEDVLDESEEEQQRAWFVIRFEPIDLSPTSLKRVARGTVYGRDLGSRRSEEHTSELQSR